MPNKLLKMHILFFSHYFTPEGNAPASRVHAFCKNWVKKGHQVTVITSAPNVPNGIVYKGYKNKFLQKENIDGIQVIRVWTYLSANKGTLKRILNYLSYMFTSLIAGIFVKKVDLIISTSPQFFCGWAGLLLAKLKFKKNILEIRDIWPDSIVAVGAMKESKIITFLKYLELKMYSWSTHIITVGEGYKKELISKGVPESKIDIISNGIDTTQYQPKEKDLEIIGKYHLKNKYICSYIGTIGMASGLNIVIEAAKSLLDKKNHDIHFLLIGDGAERTQLEKIANDLNLINVTFTGLQDKALISKFLCSTDVCLIHLQKSELFKTVIPSKIFEASAMAKPIIIGVDGEARKLIEQAKAGYFIEPENSQEFVKSLLSIKNDPTSALEMGLNGRNFVVEKFDHQQLAINYEVIISRIMKS